MARLGQKRVLAAAAFGFGALMPVVVSANGGPFVINYPGGDSSAKGELARVHPDLRPGREERLRVLKEDLEIVFQPITTSQRGQEFPLPRVTAAYQIENPTDQAIEIDFGFPILRGVYASIWGGTLGPDVSVTVDGKPARADVILPATIYGLTRHYARAVIDKALAEDRQLDAWARKARSSEVHEAALARRALSEHLQAQRKWSARDAALFVEYASIDVGNPVRVPQRSVDGFWLRSEEFRKLTTGNLGPLAAIGEQKATQLLTHLAQLFDPEVAVDYEALFRAWGGDVRDRAVDLTTGRIRLRRNDRPKAAGADSSLDPTVYARVDYLDAEWKKLTKSEKRSCEAILQNLPVTFTFAIMNLLHYKVEFAPRSTQIVKVSYSQYAYEDSGRPSSYQLAYVIHPASFWKDFGPIHLTVRAPARTPVSASVACAKVPDEKGVLAVRSALSFKPLQVPAMTCRGEVTDKTGELFVAVGVAEWERLLNDADHGIGGAASAER
jgi:hypothetical protein